MYVHAYKTEKSVKHTFKCVTKLEVFLTDPDMDEVQSLHFTLAVPVAPGGISN